MSPIGIERQARTIANNIERKSKIMQDNPVAEQIRLQTIRNMPQNLTLKRSVKSKLKISVDEKLKRKPIGIWIKLYYQISMIISKVIFFIKLQLFLLKKKIK